MELCRLLLGLRLIGRHLAASVAPFTARATVLMSSQKSYCESPQGSLQNARGCLVRPDDAGSYSVRLESGMNMIATGQ